MLNTFVFIHKDEPDPDNAINIEAVSYDTALFKLSEQVDDSEDYVIFNEDETVPEEDDIQGF